jgi:uncharacterized membrane protein YsdA (DUF1294 family)
MAALLAVFRVGWTWYYLLAAWLIAVNVVTFGFYGHDKRQARTNGGRIPEVVLHGLALMGGTLGAYAGIVFFRHKTIKPSFRLIFGLIAVLQMGLVVAVIYRLWAHSSGRE